MTHIIMSGPIKPLTEIEKAFAIHKLRKLRLADPETKTVHERPLVPPKISTVVRAKYKPYTHEIDIDGRPFVTCVRCRAMLKRGIATVATLRARDGWERRPHPMEGRVAVYAKADVMRTLGRRRYYYRKPR